jgi:cyanophycin synthetase
LEDLIEGRDLRLQLLEGRLVAACVRRPASVIGDGRSTVAQLMTALDSEVRAKNPANRCVPDADTERALAKQSLGLASTPGDGAFVTVKTVANLAVGASVVDVTDDVHPTWRRWATEFAELIDLPFFAMDAITPDPGLDPVTCGAAVLEANARPEWLHHTFSERRTHDLPRQILRALFASAT